MDDCTAETHKAWSHAVTWVAVTFFFFIACVGVTRCQVDDQDKHAAVAIARANAGLTSDGDRKAGLVEVH